MATELSETFIQDAILKAINQEIECQMDLEMHDLRSRVEARVRSAVGSIAASVMSNYSMERVGRDLLIRVKIEGES